MKFIDAQAHWSDAPFVWTVKRSNVEIMIYSVCFCPQTTSFSKKVLINSAMNVTEAITRFQIRQDLGINCVLVIKLNRY